MRHKLIGTTGDQSFELRDGPPLIVGRASSSDIPILDPTVSRRHAELACGNGTILVRDLASSNGTFVNGQRVEQAQLAPGDVITFGKVPFRLTAVTAPIEAASPTREAPDPLPAPGQTIVRERPFNDRGGPLSTVFRASDLAELRARPAAALADRTQKRLALLLEVSKGLSRAIDIDALLDTITGMVFQIMDVDRVAIELVDASGQRATKIARDRHGPIAARAIPQSIARRVIGEKVAIVSDNAPEDERFGGESIVMQSVRSAMCAPLIGADDVVHGVLYVDNLTTTQRFDDDDLDFLIAFSNIAAVAIENSRFAERIRRELLVRSNLERFFAPNLAAQIAASVGELQLGGEKRAVAVLFSDIRGFTALSEELAPGDVARLLTEYFTEMVDVVLRHGGTLDKFIGDAIMAQWGAPVGSAQDADRALAAALDMMRELDALNAKWAGEGRPPLQIGIGLNYGDAFAGYLGSERRLEYTVIGDPVNIASRLCSAAGAGEILITEELRAALSAPPSLEPRGEVELRGKTQAVPVYRVTT